MDERRVFETQCINTIRFLSVDAVQKANSGHPGAPLGAATMAFGLWHKFLRHNPANPHWHNRDRFVLSAGHASMLQYSLLHLTGYDLTIDDIKNFRQVETRTPGHPEYGKTDGVEVTTGPLGQGFAHGVGMALAERWMAEKFNQPGFPIVDNHTYGIVSDGDLQEGISYEAASYAGFLGLGKLIYLYDDNDIQIEGSTHLTEREDIRGRFEAASWQVIDQVDGEDLDGICAALEEAKAETGKPSLIIVKTKIGFGSPLENSESSHGAPLGEENVQKTKHKLGWPMEPAFYVPPEAQQWKKLAHDEGEKIENEWNELFAEYEKKHPALAREYRQLKSGKLPEGWDDGLDELFPAEGLSKATRVFNGEVLNRLAEKLPLIGGSADLGTSVKTVIKNEESILPGTFRGRNLHFGVREHAMGAIINGMHLYGGLRPYCSSFFVFVDYMRTPIRLAALMKINSLFIFSHDSIGVGEDGPTHQPIEQLMNLRSIPNLSLIRPCDAHESVEAWRAAITREDGPTVLIFSRQKVPAIDRTTCHSAKGLHKGAYVLWQSGEGEPSIILMGTGSETHIALETGRKLAGEGENVRVVSFPSWDLFDQQDDEYRESVLPATVRKRVAIEAGTVMGWERYVGLDGKVVGMRRFGSSAPGADLYEKFDITPEELYKTARSLLD